MLDVKKLKVGDVVQDSRPNMGTWELLEFVEESKKWRCKCVKKEQQGSM